MTVSSLPHASPHPEHHVGTPHDMLGRPAKLRKSDRPTRNFPRPKLQLVKIPIWHEYVNLDGSAHRHHPITLHHVTPSPTLSSITLRDGRQALSPGLPLSLTSQACLIDATGNRERWRTPSAKEEGCHGVRERRCGETSLAGWWGGELTWGIGVRVVSLATTKNTSRGLARKD